MSNCVASYYIGLANVNSVTGFGNDDNPITKVLRSEPQDQPMQDAVSETSHSTKFAPNAQQFPNALRLFTGTYDVVCRRWWDPNILPFLHISLVFVFRLTFCPGAMEPVAPNFPWKLTALMLNKLISASAPSEQDVSQPQDLSQLLKKGAAFPGLAVLSATAGASGKEGEQGNSNTKKIIRHGKPLPDDYALRGFLWSNEYFPEHWFDTDEKIGDDEKYFELPSMMEERRARLVWLGGRIAEYGTWLRLEDVEGGGKRFGVPHQYEVDLQLPPKPVESVEGEESMEYRVLPDATASSTQRDEVNVVSRR